MALKSLFALLFVACSSLALGAEELSVTSPNGHLRFILQVDALGVPHYRVFDQAAELIASSRLGLSTLGAEPDHSWDAGLKVNGSTTRENNSTWKQVWGERAEVPDRYHEITVSLKPAGTERGTLQIIARAYDEGIAFRYLFPEDLQNQVIELGAERTEFCLPSGTQGYWTPEAQLAYEKRPLKNWRRDCELPLTLELSAKSWLCIAEAAQTNYPRMRLKTADENHLVSQLFGEAVETSPYGTPWRVILVADQPGRLLEHNYLMLNLNAANTLADTSWIHPGKVMREVTLSTAGAKRLVDFAVEQNIDYIHFDAGWYGFEYTAASDATQVAVDPRRNPKGDLDLPEAIRYAKSKGKRVILYVNQRALARQIDTLFPLYRRWGVDGVKFGFVHTGSHRWVVWLHEAVRKAAENHLVVDIHDNYRPTGYSRTYPNLLQQEGILGDEGFPDATQNTIYPFTRFIAGAADHTYCFYDPRLKNSKAHQLALAAINFGPLQYLSWYDRPEQYVDRSEIEFWKDLPTVWDETRVIAGTPGQFIVTARRRGNDWWLGAITNVDGRTLAIALDFLPPTTTYLAEIYEDTADKTIKKRTQVVSRELALAAALRPSGGVAVRLRAQP